MGKFSALARFLRITYLWILLAPWAVFLTGAGSNDLVMLVNGGKFPVLLNEKRAVANAADPAGYIDSYHVVMSSRTHLNLLGDIFDRKEAVLSIGDYLLGLGEWLMTFTPYLWGAFLIKRVLDSNETRTLEVIRDIYRENT